MSEENTSVVESPAETVETVAETPAETAPEAPTTSDDVWAKPFEIPAEEEETPEGEEIKAEETPAAPEADETPTETVEEEEEEPEKETLEASADRPAPLSRRKLREAEEKVLTPLRDPDTPIEDVFKGLHEIDPVRANALAAKLVNESAKQFPNEWLETITGIEGITLDTVKQKFSETPTQVRTGDEFEDVVKKLDEFYDDAWRDPARDSEILPEDLPYVKLMRTQLDKAPDPRDAEIESLKAKLGDLEPQINDIKTQQEAAFEQSVATLKETTVQEYQSQIEKRSLPKLFDEAGLKVSENDTDGIKAVKEFVQAQFKPADGFMSPFEQFAVSQYSGREDLAKIIGRVDKYLAEASRAEVKAKQAKDRAEFDKIASTARENAKAEQDRLTVIHKKASQEFLKTLQPLMSVLEENADLQRRLGQITGRKEIVGQTSVAANADTWRDKLQQATNTDDLWKTDALSDRLATASR